MKEKIEMMERRIESQKEEVERVKSKILNTLKDEMTTENLNTASIVLERETRKLYELEAKIEIMYAIEGGK